MQLLKLQLRNINALKGEHTIDFTAPAFRTTGIFAITGNTGAGKTSILDAITLALYGKTPRKPEKSVITHGMREAAATLEFSVNGKAYRAKWSIKTKKKSNETYTPKMEVAQLPSGAIIASDRLKEVHDAIIDLIGLNFDQFTKSVLLAQGDFAAFLDAKVSDRSEILEKITGRTDYSDISKAAFERYNAAQKALHTTQATLAGFELLSDEKQDELNAQIAQAQDQRNQLQSRIQQLEIEAQRLQTQQKLLSEQATKQAQRKQYQAQQTEQALDFKRLAQHQRVAPHRHLLDRFQQLPQALEAAQQQANATYQALTDAKHQQQVAAQKQQVAETELNQFLETALPTQRQYIAQARELDRQRQTLQAQQQDHRKAAQKCQVEIDRLTGSLQKNAQEQTNAQEAQQAAQTFLAQHDADQLLIEQLPDWLTQLSRLAQLDREIADDHTRIAHTQAQQATQKEAVKTTQATQQAALQLLDQRQAQLLAFAPDLTHIDDYSTYHDALQQSLKVSEQLYSEWRDLAHWAQSSDMAQSQLQVAQAAVSEREQRVKQLATDIQAQESQVATAKAIYDDKAKIVQLEIKLANFEAHRQQLVEGEKCPLCFSTHHPCHDAGYQPEIQRSKAEQEAEHAAHTLESARQQLSHLRTEHATQRNALDQAKKQHQEAEATLQDLRQELAAYSPSAQQWVLHTPAPRLEAARAQVKQSRDKRDQQQEQAEQLRRLRQDYDKAAQDAQSKSVELEHAQQRLHDTTQQLALQQQQRADRQEEQQAIQSALLQQLAPLGITTISTDLGEVLKRRRDTFASEQRKLEEAQTALTVLQNNHHNLTQQLDQQQAAFAERQVNITDLEEKITHLQEELGAILPQLKDSDINTAERLLNEQEKALRQADQTAREELNQANTHKLHLSHQHDNALQKVAELREEQTQSQDQLTAQAHSLALPDINAMIEALLDPQQAAAIEQRQTELRNNMQQLDTRLQEIAEELKAFAESPYSAEQLASVQQERNTLQEERDALLAQIAECQTQLDSNRDRQQKAAELQMRLQTQQQEHDIWDQLNTLIGSKNGQRFNQFAQGLTLKRLLVAANAHLQRLFDRYHLVTIDTNNGVDLAIKDRDLGGTERAPSTLSGGERFIVSLALALGLSDLSGSRTRIDSLFIDEGFGTLDARHLETVLQVLDNLQQQGKMIGIISHVPALKERIATQIVVESVGSGYSRISVQS